MNAIGIDKYGIFAFDMPDIETCYPKECIEQTPIHFLKSESRYVCACRLKEVESLEAAKRDRVYFKNQQEAKTHLHWINNTEPVHQGKSYPVPEGYSIEIKEDPTTPLDQTSYPSFEKYAILVPKQEPCKFGGVPDNCNNETCWDLQECQRPILVLKEMPHHATPTIATYKLEKPEQSYKSLNGVKLVGTLVPNEKGAGDDYPVINEYHSTEKCKSQAGIFEEDFGAKIEGDDGTLPSKTILPFEPKTKDQIDREIIEMVFPETIEEAAEKLFPFIDNPYIEEDITETNRHIRTQRINWIVGAKSNAARDYWYEQFKNDKEYHFNFLNDFLTCLSDDGVSSKREIIDRFLNSYKQFKKINL